MLAYIAMVHLCSAFLMQEKVSRYPDKYRNGLDFPDNETPYIPDRICPVNESRKQGSRYQEFRLTRPHCIIEDLQAFIWGRLSIGPTRPLVR